MEMEERQGGGEKKGVKEKVVELSVQSGVSSAFTAFIAVHKVDGKAVQGPMLRRQVPTPMLCQSSMTMLVSTAMPWSMLCSKPKMMGMHRRMDRGRKGALLAKDSRDDVSDSDIQYGVPSDSGDDVSDSDIQYGGNYKGFDCPAPASNPAMDPLLQLISLQKASGSWVLEAALAEVLGKTEEELAKPKPAPVDQEVWATVLALVWLYGFKMEAQEEWQFLAMKAVSWIQAQKVASVSECVQAGNTLLGCQVQKETLGL
eukprot:XP_014070608.1 PREDICTED: von Willebrand factor A domain-containing protein 5A-like isoform X8 [Salmo salar]